MISRRERAAWGFVAPSLIAAAPKVLATAGVPAVTTRH